MGRIVDFFKNFKKRYDAQVIRNDKLDKFLGSQDQRDKAVNSLNTKVDSLTADVEELNNKVTTLSDDVSQIHASLEIIGAGTKMELFDTLYHWKKILVERGWKTEAEMREVEEIYRIYHDGLGGNGQGEKYYEMIKDLDEKELTPDH